MAFTFNGAAKTITHSGGTLSVAEMWSRYVDWLATGDNSKYGELLTTVGRDQDDIPLYVFLETGVTIVISNNSIPSPVVDGVLKTRSGGDPFGGAVVNARLKEPGIAIGYSTTGGTSGPSAGEIAAAVWGYSPRTLTSGGTGGSAPTAAENAAAVRTELSTELGRIDATVSSRMAAASYVAPETAANIAAAVGARNVEGDISLDELLRVALAVLAGRSTGIGTSTEQYLSQTGTPRVTATFDEDGNRTSVVLNGA